MGARKHLIIGCGSAGLSAAEEIRRINSEDGIRIVTAEDCPPYSPTLLPYLLSGKIDEAKLPIRKNNYFDTIKATMIRGKKITAIDPEAKDVVYEDGGREGYDTLLIATGARSSLPPIKGVKKASYLGFHTFDDCNRLLSRLKDKKEVAVLGAGLVGMEVAIALMDRGCRVTIIEREPWLLPIYFDQKAASIIGNIFSDHGVRLMVGKEVSELSRENETTTISFSDGDVIDTEFVVTCTGVKARTEFLEGSGMTTSQGVLVDHQMMTSEKDIYAAGDVAEAPGFFDGKHGINQIIESAVDQGRVAGSNMAGVKAEYEGWIPCNIFHFFGNVSFSAGLSNPDLNSYYILTSENREKSQYKKLVYDGLHLVGAICINIDVDPGLILYLMRKRVPLDGYRKMLFEEPKKTSRWLMMESEHKGTKSIQG